MTTFIAVYLHTIDPYAVKLWDGGPIRWYGLSYLLGFLVAYYLIRRVAYVGRSPIKLAAVGDFLVTIAIGVIVGGRLGYVLFYQPQMLWTLSDSLPYWDLLAINKGGMASHGGIIGVILACGWYARRVGGSERIWLHLLDLVSFAAPLGLFFGRIANFVNGELIGRKCSPELPWAVKFPQEMFSWSHEQLLQLALALESLSKKHDAALEDLVYRVPHLIELIQSGHGPLIRTIEPLLTPRHPSQIYQALLEGLLLFVILAIVWAKPRKPGVLGGVFCSSYGVLRIVGECFRQPDAHIGFQWLGMTRGQWLSVLMLALGMILWVVFSKRNAKCIGGWRREGGDVSVVRSPFSERKIDAKDSD